MLSPFHVRQTSSILIKTDHRQRYGMTSFLFYSCPSQRVQTTSSVSVLGTGTAVVSHRHGIKFSHHLTTRSTPLKWNAFLGAYLRTVHSYVEIITGNTCGLHQHCHSLLMQFQYLGNSKQGSLFLITMNAQVMSCLPHLMMCCNGRNACSRAAAVIVPTEKWLMQSGVVMLLLAPIDQHPMTMELTPL